MIRYHLLYEMSVNKLHKDVVRLFDEYKNKFHKVSDVIAYIANQLNVSKNEVMQVLQYSENKE